MTTNTSTLDGQMAMFIPEPELVPFDIKPQAAPRRPLPPRAMCPVCKRVFLMGAGLLPVSHDCDAHPSAGADPATERKIGGRVLRVGQVVNVAGLPGERWRIKSFRGNSVTVCRPSRQLPSGRRDPGGPFRAVTVDRLRERKRTLEGE